MSTQARALARGSTRSPPRSRSGGRLHRVAGARSDPFAGTRAFVISGRSFELWVNFSGNPVADATLDRLNEVLARRRWVIPRGPSPPQANTWIPPTFGRASDWNVASTGPVPADSEALTETWAANVPLLGRLVAVAASFSTPASAAG
jgi:hypothetical protein